MIILHARLKLSPDGRAVFDRLRGDLVQASRAEEGCISYAVYQAFDAPDEIIFVEEWASRDAVDRHFRSPHFAKVMQALPSMIVGFPEIRLHEVTGSSTLP